MLNGIVSAEQRIRELREKLDDLTDTKLEMKLQRDEENLGEDLAKASASPNEKGGDEKDAEFEKANRELTTQLDTSFELLLRNLVRYPSWLILGKTENGATKAEVFDLEDGKPALIVFANEEIREHFLKEHGQSESMGSLSTPGANIVNFLLKEKAVPRAVFIVDKNNNYYHLAFNEKNEEMGRQALSSLVTETLIGQGQWNHEMVLRHKFLIAMQKSDSTGGSDQNLNFVLLSSHNTNFLHVFTSPYFATVFLNRHPNPEDTNIVFLEMNWKEIVDWSRHLKIPGIMINMVDAAPVPSEENTANFITQGITQTIGFVVMDEELVLENANNANANANANNNQQK